MGASTRKRERERMTLLRFTDLDSLIPLLCISQPDGWMDVWLNKWMDGLSLGGGKVEQDVGRWSSEMEEKKRGDINLAGGRPACLSPTHTCSRTRAHRRLRPLLSVSSGPLHHIRSASRRIEGLRSPACFSFTQSNQRELGNFNQL